jgi:hypothetical protein
MLNQVVARTRQAVLEDVGEVTISHPQARFFSLDATIVALCCDTATLERLRVKL